LANYGANSVNGITYDTQDPNLGKEIARDNALGDALTKATNFVNLTGR